MQNMTILERLKPHLTVMHTNFRRMLDSFDYRILFFPPALATLLWIILANDLVKPAKPPLEIAAVIVSGMFMLIAVIRFIYTRHVFFLWSAALFLLIMCREIHFAGTDQAIFIGLAVLLGIALLKYDRFKDYLGNPRVINLLVAGFFVYFLSQTVDQRWWKVFPGEAEVFVPLEETLELLGHCTIAYAVLFCRVFKPVS
jgi:hypothetical protein